MEKLTVTVHIRISERTEKALKALAEADRRKMATYAGIVLEKHAEAAIASGEVKLPAEAKTRGRKT